MPIPYKSLLSSGVANNTFLDKTINDGTTGKLGLNNSQPESGDIISNAQAQINKNSSIVLAEASKSESDTISLDAIKIAQDHPLIGSGVAVSLAILPFGSTQSCVDGSIITLIGGGVTFTVKILDNRNIAFGCVLNGSAELGIYDVLILKFNLQKQRYIEIGRNF
jgi:hypothetical protein